MMEKILIRDGEEKDLEALLGLLKQLFAIEADFSFNLERQKLGLQLLLSAKAQARVRVLELELESGKVVVAMYSMQKLISSAEGGPVGLIEDVVVDAAWRGKKLGKRLLMDAENCAKELGWLRLQLAADTENAAALAFYQSQGWQQTQLGFLRKKLSK